MGRRSFDVVDLTELFVHWEAGRSQVQIGESLNLDRKTVRKFLAPALAEGLVPGGPPAGELVWAQRIAGWFPGLSDARLRQVTWPAIEAHRDYIVAQLQGRGDGVHDQFSAVRGEGADGVGVLGAAVDRGEPGRGGRPASGVGAARAGGAGQRGAMRNSA